MPRSVEQVELTGTAGPDGALALYGPIKLEPKRVKVWIAPLEPPKCDSFLQRMQVIWNGLADAAVVAGPGGQERKGPEKAQQARYPALWASTLASCWQARGRIRRWRKRSRRPRVPQRGKGWSLGTQRTTRMGGSRPAFLGGTGATYRLPRTQATIAQPPFDLSVQAVAWWCFSEECRRFAPWQSVVILRRADHHHTKRDRPSRRIRDERLGWRGPPALLQALLLGDLGACPGEHLRSVADGAEILPEAFARQLAAQPLGADVVNDRLALMRPFAAAASRMTPRARIAARQGGNAAPRLVFADGGYRPQQQVLRGRAATPLRG